MLTIDIYKCKCVKQNLKEINSGQVLNFHFFPQNIERSLDFTILPLMRLKLTTLALVLRSAQVASPIVHNSRPRA